MWQSVPADKLPELRSISLRSGVGSPMLRVGYLKVFMDGTLGSQTAWMLDGSGVRITSGEELAEIVREGAAAGWPVGVHAIGDGANREALDAFAQTRDAWQPHGLRQRIEHAQCLAPEDVARFGALGVAASVQFTHAPSDEELAKRFWADKLGSAYSFRSLLDSGAILANGSDAPVEELDPWAGVVAAVLGHWRKDQRPHGRAGAARDVRRTVVALPRRARPRHARAGPLCRPRRARPRPVHMRAGGASRGPGGGDDGRRAVGAQPAALGLSVSDERATLEPRTWLNTICRVTR